MPEDLGFGVPTPKEYYHLYRQQEEDSEEEEMDEEEEGGVSAAATAEMEVEEVQGGGETEEDGGIDTDRLGGGGSQGAQARSDVLEQRDEELKKDMQNQTSLQEIEPLGGGELETVLRERKELLDELAGLLGIDKKVSLTEDGLAALRRINKDVSLADLRKVFKVEGEGQQVEGKGAEGGEPEGDAEGLENYSEEALLRELERRRALKACGNDRDEGRGKDSGPGP